MRRLSVEEENLRSLQSSFIRAIDLDCETFGFIKTQEFINTNKNQENFQYVLNVVRIDRGGVLNMSIANNNFNLAFFLIENGCVENSVCCGQSFVASVAAKRFEFADEAKNLLAKFVAKNVDQDFSYLVGQGFFLEKDKDYVKAIFDGVKNKQISEPRSVVSASFCKKVANAVNGCVVS